MKIEIAFLDKNTEYSNENEPEMICKFTDIHGESIGWMGTERFKEQMRIHGHTEFLDEIVRWLNPKEN